jgi:hypothetical protein
MKPPTSQELPTRHPLRMEYGKLVFGSVGLVVLAALAFILTNEATKLMESWNGPDFLKYMAAGVVLAVFFLLIGWFLLRTLEWPILNILHHNANVLTRTTDKLTTFFLGSSGVLVDLETLVNSHRAQYNIGQVALVEREFDNLQKAFVTHSGLSSPTTNTLTLRIVGTMLGTYGQYGLGLADEISDLFKERAGYHSPPFHTAYFGAPGHLVGSDEDAYASITGLNCLYPYSARITACKLLLSVCETLNNELHSELGDTLRVNIRFLRVSDIFPAMQLWGDECGMVLFSTGHQDRQAARAVPVAVMLKKEVSIYSNSTSPMKLSLANTLKRLNQHLKRDFGLDHPSDRMESWELDAVHRTLRVVNCQQLLEAKTLREKLQSDIRTAPEIVQIDRFNDFAQSGTPIQTAEIKLMIEAVGSMLQTLTTPVTV